jgi:hypothetical protein
MKMFTLLFLLISFNLWAQNNLTAVAVNSPVQGTQVKIELDPPKNYVIKEVEYVLHDEKGKPISSPEKWNTVGLSSTTPKPIVTITVNQPPGDYKLHLRTIPKDGKPGKRNVMVPFTLAEGVPDPGEAGKLTLEGIDSDKDGVRDDVQIWINKKFPVASKPNTNKAFQQLAKYSQLTLKNYQDKEKATFYHNKEEEALECLMWVMNSAQKVYRLEKEVAAQFYNTKPRIKAYLTVNSYLHGQGTPDSILGTKDSEMNRFCEFEASKE